MQIRSHVSQLGQRAPASSSRYFRMLTPSRHTAWPNDQPRPASIVLENLAEHRDTRGRLGHRSDDGALPRGTRIRSPRSPVPATAISVFFFDGDPERNREPVEIPMSLAV